MVEQEVLEQGVVEKKQPQGHGGGKGSYNVGSIVTGSFVKY